MQVDFDSKVVTLTLEDVRQIFNMQFGETQLGKFEVVLESNPSEEQPEEQELWYPDDSGEWVEVSDKEGMKKFKNKDWMRWLLPRERENKNYTEGVPMQFDELKFALKSGNIFARPIAMKLAR